MSVLDNWETELRRWGRMLPGGEFGAERVHGQSRDDAWTRATADGSRCEIVLTTYDTLVRNSDAFASRTWSACVFDEAHQLKNDKTKRYEAAYSLQKERRFGLSGTVMQNSYDELWCLFDWACPGSLGDVRHFKEYYSKVMQQAQRHGVDDTTLGRGRDKAEQLRRLLRKYMLKRTKKDTLADQLPQKADNVVFCDMSALQIRASKRLLEMEEFQLLIRHEEPCDCGSGEKRARCCYQECTGPAPIWRSYDHEKHVTRNGYLCPYCMTFPLMQTLVKVSNHLELLKPDPEDEYGNDEAREKFEKARVVARAALGEDAHLLGGADHPDMDFARRGDATNCGKLLALEKLLSLWHRQRDKVLLFSTSARLLTVLEKFLTQRGYVRAARRKHGGEGKAEARGRFQRQRVLVRLSLIDGRRRGRVEHNVGEPSRHLRPQLEPGEGRTGAGQGVPHRAEARRRRVSPPRRGDDRGDGVPAAGVQAAAVQRGGGRE